MPPEDLFRLLALMLATLVFAATAITLLRHDAWWVRIFDFPRVQLAATGAALLPLLTIAWPPADLEHVAVVSLLVLAVLFQLSWIAAYTPIFPRQVPRARPDPRAPRLRLLVFNVLMTNRRYEDVLRTVRGADADVILLLEPDRAWLDALRPLETTHPNVVKHPLDTTYGMALYSRLPLKSARVRFLVQEEVPSIEATVALQGGPDVRFCGVHPPPPWPAFAEQTTERDAELLILGRELRDEEGPTLVAGDLNDVAWSRTTELFQRVSGLLDPRIGRGPHNTFHARLPFLRWPLDHVFHSPHFTLVSLARLDPTGSDHFPVVAELQYEPDAIPPRDVPRPDPDDDREVGETIEDLRQLRRRRRLARAISRLRPRPR